MRIRYYIIVIIIFHFLKVSDTAAQQLLINEIMANPNHASLPNYEYIELYNNSDHIIDLSELQLHINNSTASLPRYLLAPKQYVLLTSQQAMISFQPYGNVICPSSWPALNNNGATIKITRNNNTIDEVTYSASWYDTSTKRNGGWSLERINPNLSCNISNSWIASTALVGGTPCKPNSVLNRTFTPVVDILSSEITQNRLSLTFNVPYQTLYNLTSSHFHLLPDKVAPQTMTWNPTNDTLYLIFEQSLNPNLLYSLQCDEISWCNQAIHIPDKAIFDQGEILFNDIVINEVLFNPKDGGVDFIELYNRSSNPVNLQNFYLGNRPLASGILIFQPGQYLAFTTDTDIVSLHYPKAEYNNLIKVNSLPPYPNQQGIVTLYHNTTLIDSLYYSANMHDPQLIQVKGISLERQETEMETNHSQNFKSASTIAGGATPGYKNSVQNKNFEKNNIFLSSKTVSPNDDSHEDFLEINYEFASADNYISITIYNDTGAIVNRLIRHQSAGKHGTVTWNCLNEERQIVPRGIYIFQVDIYNKNGIITTKKGSFVVTHSTSTY